MPDIVTRPGLVLDELDVAAVIATLSRRPDREVGRWTVTTNRLELCSYATDDRPGVPLATVDLVHGSPHAHAATVSRVAVTETAQVAGLDAQRICAAVLDAADVRAGEAVPSTPPPATPPVFTGKRSTDRAAWEQRPGTPAEAEQAALDSAEDTELRRLHHLATFGGLSTGLAQRYAELRGRDRRRSIRAVEDDDLVLLPMQREPAEDLTTIG
jgi:hypothetical protein